MTRVLLAMAAIVAAVGCANARQGSGGDGGVQNDDAGGDDDVDAMTCGEFCDTDGDGVLDGVDECEDTATGVAVNDVGCSDPQVDPALEPTFPPFDLTWTPTGDLGRAGGLTWSYTGIDRADLFHIYWILCDDPATACGVSLDGLIDQPSEHWQFTLGASDLTAGRLVFSNTTHIILADASDLTLTGRLTVNIVDAANAPIRWETLAAMGVTGRDGDYGAEIPGTGYKITAIIEVMDTITSTYTPYLDYYDAAATADPGNGTGVSFGGSFYSE